MCLRVFNLFLYFTHPDPDRTIRFLISLYECLCFCLNRRVSSPFPLHTKAEQGNFPCWQLTMCNKLQGGLEELVLLFKGAGPCTPQSQEWIPGVFLNDLAVFWRGCRAQGTLWELFCRCYGCNGYRKNIGVLLCCQVVCNYSFSELRRAFSLIVSPAFMLWCFYLSHSTVFVFFCFA